MSIKGMTLAKGGSRLPLILGVVLGLVAAVLVVIVLTGSKDSGSTQTSSGAGVPVVVATSDIPAGTRLTAEMLGVKNIPSSDKLANAFGTTEGVVDQVTKIPLVAGEQVIPNKLAGSVGAVPIGENPPLALVVDPGMRGVSVGVSSIIGAGGNIRPGDFVDVVLIVELKPEALTPESQGTSDQVASTILQNVKVLAIDQNITNPNAETTSDPSEGESADEAATTLTLLVTPTQGEILAMSEVCGSNHGGRIAVSLRGAGDGSKLPNRAEWPNDGAPPKCSEVLGITALGE
jgi:Flp pilus assembly protein CpaB